MSEDYIKSFNSGVLNMKFSEMNERKKKATKNIKYAAEDYIFSLLNGCFDSEKGSKEYNNYLNELKDTDGLINTVYSEATTNIYEEGYCCFNSDAQKAIKDIRFCGKEFLMKTTKHYVEKYQAEALAELID